MRNAYIFYIAINITMNKSVLLTDTQVQEFLINGYLVLEPISLDGNFHSTIFTQAVSIFEKEGNPGNNILPRIPQLQYVFDNPVISGALESLLGSNYTMQPHRHAHLQSQDPKINNGIRIVILVIESCFVIINCVILWRCIILKIQLLRWVQLLLNLDRNTM